MRQSARDFTVVLFLSIWLHACNQPLPEEKQIRLAINEMQEAAEHKKLASLMAHFHASFLGRMNMRKAELQTTIYYHFRVNPRVRVYLSQLQISVEEDEAIVRCHLLVTGSQQQLPERGRYYRVTSSWKKLADSWMIVDADWEDVAAEVIEELGR